jgi:APA family basic amino acid/polyamine antiporter
VFFAFIGFDEVITLAEETRNPTRVIPRAILVSLAISTALYMAVAIAAVSVIGPGPLGTSTRPLADVMAHVLGGSAQGVVAVIALLTTTNTSLLALTAASRLTYGMAHANAIPATVARVTSKTGVPITAIAIVAVGAVGFACFGDLTLIASVTDFAVYVVFLAVNATVIVLRRRTPDAQRSFRIPGAVRGVPVVPVVASLVTLTMLPQLDPASLWIGVALLGVGGIAYKVLDRTGAAHEDGSRVERRDVGPAPEGPRAVSSPTGRSGG